METMIGQGPYSLLSDLIGVAMWATFAVAFFTSGFWIPFIVGIVVGLFL